MSSSEVEEEVQEEVEEEVEEVKEEEEDTQYGATSKEGMKNSIMV